MRVHQLLDQYPLAATMLRQFYHWGVSYSINLAVTPSTSQMTIFLFLLTALDRPLIPLSVLCACFSLRFSSRILLLPTLHFIPLPGRSQTFLQLNLIMSDSPLPLLTSAMRCSDVFSTKPANTVLIHCCTIPVFNVGHTWFTLT